MTESRVELPNPFDLNAYTWTIMSLAQTVDSGHVVLDFSRCTRAYPDGVLPLIATVNRMRSEGRDIEVVPPTAKNLAGVFQGVGWTQYLVEGESTFLDLSAQTRKFTPARPFRTGAELDVLRESILHVALTQGKLAEWLPEAIQWTLWEVMENVLNHAQSECGWVQASTFSERRHINFVVVDSGIGIRASLAGLEGGLDDQRAIKRAVEEGVTRDPNSNAGFGLTGCRAITADNRGQMVVYSGSSLMRQEFLSASRPELRRYTPVLGPHQGTIVELQLRMDRPVDLEKALGQKRPVTILELEHDVEGEFVFTVADEAANLGTRESGRQIRNKVRNLTQVEDERVAIDFSGVEMVSSSFADEFVAKLAAEVGRDAFYRRYVLRGMNSSVKAIVLPTLWLRLEGSRSAG